MTLTVRKPVVSGAFYPGEKKQLNQIVERLVDDAPVLNLKGRIRMIVTPHAGYEYSGAIAANVYKQIKGKSYHRVVVIGPSHQSYFRGIVVDKNRSWLVPVGEVPVDDDGVDKLVAAEKNITVRSELFDAEHSLEVQIPFLLNALPDIKVMPVMIGDQSINSCRMLGDALAKAFKNEEILIVASSDLYHGYSYEDCVATDRTTIKFIEDFDPEALSAALEQGRAQACGGGAIVAGLIAASQLGGKKVTIVKYANSSDVTGSRGGYVVGYVAALVLNCSGLTEKSEAEILRLARQTIENSVQGKAEPDFKPAAAVFEEKLGVFVTLKRKGRLRGCIGYVEGTKPLYEAIPKMARAAAFEDPRFPPLSQDELTDLEIEVTLLSPLKQIKKLEEIEVGRHGILMRAGFNQGLLLPQVAVEEKWDRETFLMHTCLKAGLNPDAYKKQGIDIYIFEGHIIKEKGGRS